MGANCCVVARDKPFPVETRFVVSVDRSIRYSPSSSIRWENRALIEDIRDNPAWFPHHLSGNALSKTKSGADTGIDGLLSRGSAFGPFQKPVIKTRNPRNSKDDNGTADKFLGTNSSSEEPASINSSDIASASDTSPSISIPSLPPSSAFNLDPSSSRRCSHPFDPTSSTKPRCSPQFQVSRQVSDSRIPSRKSRNVDSSPEERRSFALNDLSTEGLTQGGSPDGGSTYSFTKLMASSQRETKAKITRSKTQPLLFPASDPKTCGVCSKRLTEMSQWSTQKIMSTNELPVVAVLVCGHVYHAECLETMTNEPDRYEPPCLVCTNGEKSASKLSRKAESKARSKISRIAVADAFGDFDSISESGKQGKEGPQMGASSSMKSSYGLPFLGRHFSMGARPKRLVSENESMKKKGFWASHRRD